MPYVPDKLPLGSDVETNFTFHVFIYFAGAGLGGPRHMPTVPALGAAVTLCRLGLMG
jgi:hypothetical protein